MSPVPGPTPLRGKILRTMFSPAGLMCGFVVLLMATCPNARGEDAVGLLADASGLPAMASADLRTLETLALVPADTRPVGVATSPISAARFVSPQERGPRSLFRAQDDLFPHSRTALPLIVAPLPSESDPASAVGVVSPLTGPAVGVPRKLPVSRR